MTLHFTAVMSVSRYITRWTPHPAGVLASIFAAQYNIIMTRTRGEIGNILGPSQVVMESMSHVGGWRWWRAGPRPSLWRWRRERVAVAGARMRGLLGANLINLPGTRTTPPCPPLPRPPPSTHKILSRAPPLVTIRLPSQSPQSLSQS